MNTLLTDEYQFHDNFVHGIYFDINPGGIKSELHFDIDHIMSATYLKGSSNSQMSDG